ncbi:hypothetical protein C5167_004192 [Papaver somniferum]|nr:hypothetical protein C5167_004192 [Papaver somniferum]
MEGNKRNMRLEHFDEKKTDAQNRASCPNEVIDTQWANMSIYWRSPEFKSENEETTQKKASRAAVYQKTYRAKEGKGDQYSKIMEAEKQGWIRGVGSTIKVTQLTGESSSNVVQNNEENAALRDEIKKLKEDHVHMQNDMEEERLEMKKTVDDMKKANEESQKKIDALLLLFAGRRDLPHPEP